MTIRYLAAEERQCGMKRTYLNSTEAKRAARRMETFRGGGKMSVYRCPPLCQMASGSHSEVAKV